MKKIIFFIALSIGVFYTNAQNKVPCITDELFQEALIKHPELRTQVALSDNLAARTPDLQKKAGVTYIPVVFHVIHKYGFENISQAQLNDAIRVMNEDFRKKAGTNGGASTDSLAVDMQYEYRLAQFDPNGQPTNGVNRIYNTGTDNAREPQKALSYWDARKYFNIWVVSSIQNTGDPNSIVLGYAQFPDQINTNTTTDGVMARYDQLGMVETADLNQAGRTLTHESGHWVGLYHPFQGGCVGATSSNCAYQGDWVCDTPPVSTSTSGCPSSRNSCTNDLPDLPDMVKNYMDYADGNCMNLYTPGQKARSQSKMSQYRSNIYSTSNLNAAGVNSDGTYIALTAATVKAPYQFGFNMSSLAGTGWTVDNYMSPGDSGWQINNTLGAAGSGCMAAMNLKNYRTNIRNAVSTPAIDISTLANPTLNFYVAYAKKTTASGDKIKIYISNSFGRSEILVRTLTSSEMETGAVSTTSFIPNSGEWRKFSIDLSEYKTYSNCKIRFELQSLRGNNIYFDEFSISEPTGVAEILKSDMDFNLYPNPVNEITTISFSNSEVREMEINLLDIQGRYIKQIAKREFSSGKHEMTLNVNELNPGMYLVQVKTIKGNFVQKMLVE